METWASAAKGEPSITCMDWPRITLVGATSDENVYGDTDAPGAMGWPAAVLAWEAGSGTVLPVAAPAGRVEGPTPEPPNRPAANGLPARLLPAPDAPGRAGTVPVLPVPVVLSPWVSTIRG